MNKFGVAFALIVGLVGLVSAHKIRHGLEDEHELRHLGHHGGHGFRHGGIHRGGLRGGHSGFEGGHLGHLEEEFLSEELPRRHRYGGRHSGFGGGLGRSGRIGRRSGLSGIGGGLGGSRLGLGAVGGAGAAGFRDSESEFGALNAGSHGFESGLAERTQAGLLAGQKGFDAGQHFNSHNDNEGVHKHQVIDSDKTIIKDKTTGVNDFDSFRTSNGVNQGSNVAANESGVAAGAKSSKVAGERENDSHINAVGAERAEATGVAGAAF